MKLSVFPLGTERFGALRRLGARRKQAAQVLDRIYLVGALVGPVPFHAGKAQRHPARIARRDLHAFKGNLDHQLGTHQEVPTGRSVLTPDPSICHPNRRAVPLNNR